MVNSSAEAPEGKTVQKEAGKECDLIMKGGIASGIVYPRAVLALKDAGYRFRCIGGASAGAIAATVTAAAEYGRETGGFDRLAALNDRLCEEGFLRGLFQSSAKTRALLAVTSALFPGANSWPKPVGVAWALARGMPSAWLAGAALGAGAGEVLMHTLGAATEGVARAALWSACGLAGTGIMVGVTLLRQLLKHVPDNGFGLCSGHIEKPDPSHPALTDWLTAEIERIGGKTAGTGPLTFGDLARRGIRLQMMTTDVSRGLPYALPFDTHEFLFCESDMAKLFPAVIVRHLVDKAHTTARVTPPAEFHFLPPAADLPVVFAMRLSLSFPVLLSAVPLYTLNFAQTQTGQTLDRHWFSDGGLCSNFPIHFFDAWLPTRPTFGINLTADDGGPAVRLPRAGEITPRPCRALTNLGGFLGALVSTMQNHRDNLQAQMPSYRERIVQVRLGKAEGGLNLEMPAATLCAVAQKGADAGRVLAEEFRWDAHQWTRFRVLIARLEMELKRMDACLQSRQFDMEALIPAPNEPRLPYARSRKWRRQARQVLDGIHALAVAWPEGVFQEDCPKPASELRLTPMLSVWGGDEGPPAD